MSDERFNDIGPWTAFQQPVPLPDTLPTDPPFWSICVNAKWVGYLIGALLTLAQPETWTDDAATLEPVRGAIYTLISSWMEGCVGAMQFQQINGCELQVSFNGGLTWETIYDGQTCIAKNLEDGTLAGGSKTGITAGTPNNCVIWHPSIDSRGAWQIPNLVNSGDTITVTVDVIPQAWTDNIFDPVLYCANGTFFDLVTFCGAGDPAHSGDPDMSANHMELLLLVGTTYYRVMAGTVTLPPGISNAQAYLIPNDGLQGDNLGIITFTVQHCAVGWTHVFDFTASDGAWVPWDGYGTYVNGVGWQSALSGFLHVRAPAIGAGYSLVGMTAEFSVASADSNPGGVSESIRDSSFTIIVEIARNDSLFQTGGSLNFVGLQNIVTTVFPAFSWAAITSTASVATLTKVTLYGVGGTDPY